MAPVPLKFVVSFSSQDERHPVGNLISGEGFKKWLSSPRIKTGQIDAVFQLDTPSVITHLDVGSLWCANIEVEVGWSSWPQTTPYRTLVATTNLMSPMDSRNGNAVVRTRMFNSNDFLQDTCSQEYDRIRLICRQPFRKDVQFGLSFIRVKGNNKNTENKTTENNNNTFIKSPKNNGCISSSPLTPKTESSTMKLHNRLLKHSPINACSVELKNRILKIDGTSEHGISNEQSLSRSAKLILASANKSPRIANTKPHKEHQKSGFVSNSIHNRTTLPFELEVKKFLSRLQINQDDLSTMTLSDLRHRLERRKLRKLTIEEKKKFIQLTEDFLHKKFEGVSREKVLTQADNGVYFEEMAIDLCADEDLPDLSVLNDITENGSPHRHDNSSSESAFVDFQSVGNSHSSNTTDPVRSRAVTMITPENLFEFLPHKITETITPEKSNSSKTDDVKFGTGSKKLFKRGNSFLPGSNITSSSDISLSPNTLLKISSACRLDLSNSVDLTGTSELNTNSNFSILNESPKISKNTSNKRIDLTPNMDRLGKQRSSSSKKDIDTGASQMQKSSKKRKTDKDAKSTSSRKKKAPILEEEDVMGAFTMCTECHKMVPQYNYLVHQGRCKYSPKSKADVIQNARSSSETVPQRKDNEYQLPVDIETSMLIQCPICSEYFSSDNINAHANTCAEMTLLA